jgi:hypothetical protein
MSGGFVDILVAVLFGAFAIASIIFIFAVAGHVFNEIVEEFQRSTLAGVGVLCLYVLGLFAVVFLLHEATLYVAMLYRQIAG